MYTYIVHAERKNIGAWQMRNGGVRIEGFNTVGKVNIPDGLHGMTEGDEVSLETWYVNNEGHANALASKLAAQRPGTNIYVAKVVGIATSAPMPAVFTRVTEKGMVPG